MEIHQLKTFVAVARERSITRASEQLHLSQPAVSAHIKALEDELGLALFERTPRGMSLTLDGQRILAKSEQALAAHQALLAEAVRIKGQLVGKLELGVGGSSDNEAISRLLAQLSQAFPEVEVTLKHGTSLEILAGIRNGSLDAGYYNEAEEPDSQLATIEVSSFHVQLVARPGLINTAPLDWKLLADTPWIYPTASKCCGGAAESLFKLHELRPKRIISVDRESMTRSLIAEGVGVGLLHADTAKEARARGEVELLCEAEKPVRVLFAQLASRAQEPLLEAVGSVVRRRV